MKELFEKKIVFNNEEIDQIKYNLLSSILNANTQEAVEAAIVYAKYLNNIGINNNNYPVFLKILDIKNSHIIDALLGTQNPFLFMNSIQLNYFIISTCFEFLNKYHTNDIYFKTLGTILGYLQTIYNSPLDGYKIYPPTIFDLNHLSKYLNKEKGKEDLNNICILNILEKISNLENQSSDEKMEDLAIYAHNIRNIFFDSSKKLEDIIPLILFKNETNLELEIQPRKLIPLSRLEKKSKKTSKHELKGKK